MLDHNYAVLKHPDFGYFKFRDAKGHTQVGVTPVGAKIFALPSAVESESNLYDSLVKKGFEPILLTIPEE